MIAPTPPTAGTDVLEATGEHPWCPCCGEIPWCQEELATDGGDFAPHLYFPHGLGAGGSQRG